MHIIRRHILPRINPVIVQIRRMSSKETTHIEDAKLSSEKNLSSDHMLPFTFDLSDSSLILVENRNGLAKMRELITSCKLMGIDTETAPSFHRIRGERSRVSLIQIAVRTPSDKEYVFILDLKRLSTSGDTMDELDEILNVSFSNKSCIKLGQSLDNDMFGLAKDYPNIWSFREVACIVEMNAMASFLTPQLNGRMVSLKTLTETYLNSNLVKSAQCSNWDLRPLSSHQIWYAACDALVLLRLYDVLLCEALEKDPTFSVASRSTQFSFEEVVRLRMIRKQKLLENKNAAIKKQEQLLEIIRDRSGDDGESVSHDFGNSSSSSFVSNVSSGSVVREKIVQLIEKSGAEGLPCAYLPARYYAEYSEILVLDNVVGMQSFLRSHPSIQVSWTQGKPEKYFFRPTTDTIDSSPNLRNTSPEGGGESSSSTTTTTTTTTAATTTTTIEWLLDKKHVDMDTVVVPPSPSLSPHTGVSNSTRHVHDPSSIQLSEVGQLSPKELADEPPKGTKSRSSKSNSIVVGTKKRRVSQEKSRNLQVVNIYDIDFNALQQEDTIQTAGKETDSRLSYPEYTSKKHSKDGKRLKS